MVFITPSLFFLDEDSAEKELTRLDPKLVAAAQRVEARSTDLGNFRTRFPQTLIYDFSSNFLLGFLGSAGAQFYKGVSWAPKGKKIRNGVDMVLHSSGESAAGYAAAAVLQSVINKGLQDATGIESEYLTYVSSSLSSGLVSWRKGWRSMVGSGIAGVGFQIISGKVVGLLRS